MTKAKAQRQRRIASLLAQRGVTSQHELVELLAAQGQPATQATVSRDLEELGAIRLRRSGHVVYALPSSATTASAALPAGEALRRLLAGSVERVEKAGALVVIRTPPGYAGMVASAIDQGSLLGVAGTVAGDDTILVVCRDGTPAVDVAAQVRELAGLSSE